MMSAPFVGWESAVEADQAQPHSPRVDVATPQARQRPCGACEREVKCGTPIACHGGDDHRSGAVGLELHLATLVDATAAAVHIRQVNLGTWNQPRQTTQ